MSSPAWFPMTNEPRYPLLALARLRMGIDGAGITTLVAGAGCPLHCRWCINRRLLKEGAPEQVTAAQLLERVRIDDLYFRASGGGVTFGGGEPLLHAEFLRQFRSLAPDEWKIRLETSLAVPAEQVIAAVEAADEFIVDCKDMNPEIYRRYTGGDCDLMVLNLRRLLDLAGAERILVRVPLIPDYNTEKDQESSAAALKSLGITRFDLFPYSRRDL